MSERKIPTSEPDGQFDSFNQWVNHATSWIGGMNALCVDAQDRVCRIGGDFMRARDESAFPVRYWFGQGGQSAREQAKNRAATRRAMGDFKYRLRREFYGA